MDEIWKQLPNDILERIAHFADIDTRRAMGFPPRKLGVTNFELPQWSRRWDSAYGGQVLWRLGDSFISREMEFGADVYRCGLTGTKYCFPPYGHRHL